jgi:hypothetical protein
MSDSKTPWLAAGLVGILAFIAMQIAMSIKTREGVETEVKAPPVEKLEIVQSNVPGPDVSEKRVVCIRTIMDAPDAGFVLPHSHVDVIANVRGTEKTICRNLLVQAVDSISLGGPGDNPYSGVYVEATAEEAEKLTLAQSQGKVRVVLIKERSPGKAENPSN